MKREFSLPQLLRNQIKHQFPNFQWSPHLTETIRFLSDNFQENRSVTPWEKDHYMHAYLAYFHALNTVRMCAVLKTLKLVAPDFETSSILDFGSGLGATEIAWQQAFHSSPEWVFIDNHPQALKYHQQIRPKQLGGKAHWHRSVKDWKSELPKVLIASYSLNELEKLPEFILDFETIIILEPSTSFHTRKLMQLRQFFLQNNYNLLAPCTHRFDCPLLKHSKKDWCYDRIHLKADPWFLSLEKNLPMQNRTLTFSYLIVSKKYSAKLPENSARVIGDTLKEKGKTRQMICRSDEREFLSWLKKQGNAADIAHGSLISILNASEKKGDELRGFHISEYN